MKCNHTWAWVCQKQWSRIRKGEGISTISIFWFWPLPLRRSNWGDLSSEYCLSPLPALSCVFPLIFCPCKLGEGSWAQINIHRRSEGTREIVMLDTHLPKCFWYFFPVSKISPSLGNNFSALQLYPDLLLCNSCSIKQPLCNSSALRTVFLH